MTQPDMEPYPDEYRKLQYAMTVLEAQFEFKSMNDTDKQIFEMAAHNEFGKAGFKIAVTWQQIFEAKKVLGHDYETPTGVWCPGIEVIGRNHSEGETDHDRIKWGVTRGLADGQAGYVREDGSKREDPIKKLIL